MATEPNSPSSAFSQHRGPDEFPRISAKREDPRLEAVLRKLVADPTMQRFNGRNRTVEVKAPDQALLQKIADTTAGNISDANSLFQILPDMELAMLILVSSILSPKDMVGGELIYRVEEGHFSSELSNLLIEVVRDHFTTTYKINDLLPDILKDSLFYTGSYVMAVLPESSIDELINSPQRVSVESLRGEFLNNDIYPLGILETPSGTPTKGGVGLESFDYETTAAPAAYNPKMKETGQLGQFVSVVDNFNVLKFPMLHDKMRQDKLQDLLGRRGLAMEHYDSTDASRPSLFRRRRYKSVPILPVKTLELLEKPTVGNPLAMHLPSESVIPVHVPGSPEEHIGYFVLLDEHGNPLNRVTETDYYRDMGDNFNSTQNQDAAKAMIRQAQAGMMGSTTNNNDTVTDLKKFSEVYASLVENDLENRLRFGVYGKNVELSKNHEVYRIMMARALAQMHTQVLYLPAELVTYFAFDFNAYGVGISLLEKSKMLGGLRSLLMFANTMASVKNSVGRTVVNITLDPEDPDPTTTVEFLLHEYGKQTRAQFPLGVSNPANLVSFLQDAAVEVAVSGNTRYPETKLGIEDRQSNHAKPDTELENEVRQRHINSIGLTPELVDSTNQPDFATTVVANNLLLFKRVMMYQKVLNADASDFVRKYTLNSQELMEKLREKLEENEDKLEKDQVAKAKSTARKVTDHAQSGGQVSARYKLSDGGLEETAETKGFDAILLDFIEALSVELPSPETGSTKALAAGFTDYAQALDEAIKAYLDESLQGQNMMGELGESMNTVIAVVRAHYLRQWMRNNNFFPELDDLITFSDEGPAVDILEVHKSHIEGLKKSLLPFIQAVMKSNQKTDQVIDKAKETTGQDDLSGEPAEAIDGPTADTGGGGDFGGDFSMPDFDAGETDIETGGGEDASTATEETSSTSTTQNEDGSTTTTSSSSSSQSSTG